MELDQLQQIIRLLKAEGLTEITVCEGDQRITVKQDLSGAVVRSPSSPVLVEPDRPAEGADDSEDVLTLTAPLVGTFYRRPAADAEPFVTPGDIVSPGDTLCFIEAMKVMNEIKAEEAGRVLRVLADDGEAVEYGQPLFIFDRL